MIDFLLEAMDTDPARLAVADGNGAWTSADLRAAIDRIGARLDAVGPSAGRVVSLEAEYGLPAVAAFLALTARSAIIVPLSQAARAQHAAFLETAQVERRVACADGAEAVITETGREAAHAIYDTLRERGTPGLVLFSSGSTGAPKAAVHDLERLLRKFKVRKRAYRTIVFLQLDHIGGVNTLLLHAVERRRDHRAARPLARRRVPRRSRAPRRAAAHLAHVPEPAAHLERHRAARPLVAQARSPTAPSRCRRARCTRVAAAFPAVKLQQTYGLTEIGILRSQSRGPDSLWVRVGGEGYETKVVDGRCWVRAESAMLGYLNAPSPFSADGLFDTGDVVEVDGEWLRILGRRSEIINVGGEKVYPAEVESVLLAHDGVRGRGGLAANRTRSPDRSWRPPCGCPPTKHWSRSRGGCARGAVTGSNLYKVPAKVRFAEGPLYSERFKRKR